MIPFFLERIDKLKGLVEILPERCRKILLLSKGDGYKNREIAKKLGTSLVKLQLDMYWAMHTSGRTPKELIAAHPDRYVMWHIKDMDRTTRDYTQLGHGSIDYISLLAQVDTSGLEYYCIEKGGNFALDLMSSA